MENVLDGERYEAWSQVYQTFDPRLLGQCTGMLLDIASQVFHEGDQLQNASEVFVKKCRVNRALSEDVSKNLKVAVVPKNLQDTELQKHCSCHLHKHPKRGRQLQPCRIGCPWSGTMDVDQVGAVKGKGNKVKGSKGGNSMGKGREAKERKGRAGQREVSSRVTKGGVSIVMARDTSNPPVHRKPSTTRRRATPGVLRRLTTYYL